MTRDFASRWLLRAGVTPEALSSALDGVRARAGRFPWPLNRLAPLASILVEWLVPLLFLGRFSRSSRLSEVEFDQLLEVLPVHPRPHVRNAFLLIQAPLFEAAAPETAAPAPPHPLESLPGFEPDGGPVEAHDGPGQPAARRTDRVFDVIVIGSGAGGAPAAWSLAGSGATVAVVEEGGLVVPRASYEAVERHYVSQGMVGAVDSGNLLILAARALGGTTVVNCGTSLRPLPECREAWDRALGVGLGAELEPFLAEVESRLGVCVAPADRLSTSSKLFARGLEALGRGGASILPRNVPGCTGEGRCCFGCPAGVKNSTDRAFLPGALERGAVLFHGARATRIDEDAGAVRVEVREAGGRTRVLAGHTLVIAAGALFTPGLIRRNCLGWAWRLAGRHLKVHPATKLLAWFPGLADDGRGIPQGLGYRPPEIPRLTMEGIHTPVAVAGPLLALAGKRVHWWLDRMTEVTSFGMMIRDRATGSIGEFAGWPWARYRLDPEDARDLGEGLVLAARSFFAAGADRVLLPIAGGGAEITSAAALDALDRSRFLPGRLAVAGFHPQGTAGMGRVVDHRLRLLGSRRIRVCDASILPDSPGVNPQLVLMALSLRLARELAGP